MNKWSKIYRCTDGTLIPRQIIKTGTTLDRSERGHFVAVGQIVAISINQVIIACSIIQREMKIEYKIVCWNKNTSKVCQSYFDDEIINWSIAIKECSSDDNNISQLSKEWPQELFLLHTEWLQNISQYDTAYSNRKRNTLDITESETSETWLKDLFRILPLPENWVAFPGIGSLTLFTYHPILSKYIKHYPFSPISIASCDPLKSTNYIKEGDQVYSYGVPANIHTITIDPYDTASIASILPLIFTPILLGNACRKKLDSENINFASKSIKRRMSNFLERKKSNSIFSTIRKSSVGLKSLSNITINHEPNQYVSSNRSPVSETNDNENFNSNLSYTDYIDEEVTKKVESPADYDIIDLKLCEDNIDSHQGSTNNSPIDFDMLESKYLLSNRSFWPYPLKHTLPFLPISIPTENTAVEDEFFREILRSIESGSSTSNTILTTLFGLFNNSLMLRDQVFQSSDLLYCVFQNRVGDFNPNIIEGICPGNKLNKSRHTEEVYSSINYNDKSSKQSSFTFASISSDKKYQNITELKKDIKYRNEPIHTVYSKKEYVNQVKNNQNYSNIFKQKNSRTNSDTNNVFYESSISLLDSVDYNYLGNRQFSIITKKNNNKYNSYNFSNFHNSEYCINNRLKSKSTRIIPRVRQSRSMFDIYSKDKTIINIELNYFSKSSISYPNIDLKSRLNTRSFCTLNRISSFLNKDLKDSNENCRESLCYQKSNKIKPNLLNGYDTDYNSNLYKNSRLHKYKKPYISSNNRNVSKQLLFAGDQSNTLLETTEKYSHALSFYSLSKLQYLTRHPLKSIFNLASTAVTAATIKEDLQKQLTIIYSAGKLPSDCPENILSFLSVLYPDKQPMTHLVPITRSFLLSSKLKGNQQRAKLLDIYLENIYNIQLQECRRIEQILISLIERCSSARLTIHNKMLKVPQLYTNNTASSVEYENVDTTVSNIEEPNISEKLELVTEQNINDKKKETNIYDNKFSDYIKYKPKNYSNFLYEDLDHQLPIDIVKKNQFNLQIFDNEVSTDNQNKSLTLESVSNSTVNNSFQNSFLPSSVDTLIQKRLEDILSKQTKIAFANENDVTKRQFINQSSKSEVFYRRRPESANYMNNHYSKYNRYTYYNIDRNETVFKKTLYTNKHLIKSFTSFSLTEKKKTILYKKNFTGKKSKKSILKINNSSICCSSYNELYHKPHTYKKQKKAHNLEVYSNITDSYKNGRCKSRQNSFVTFRRDNSSIKLTPEKKFSRVNKNSSFINFFTPLTSKEKRLYSCNSFDILETQIPNNYYSFHKSRLSPNNEDLEKSKYIMKENLSSKNLLNKFARNSTNIKKNYKLYRDDSPIIHNNQNSIDNQVYCKTRDTNFIFSEDSSNIKSPSTKSSLDQLVECLDQTDLLLEIIQYYHNYRRLCNVILNLFSSITQQSINFAESSISDKKKISGNLQDNFILKSFTNTKRESGLFTKTNDDPQNQSNSIIEKNDNLDYKKQKNIIKETKTLSYVYPLNKKFFDIYSSSRSFMNYCIQPLPVLCNSNNVNSATNNVNSATNNVISRKNKDIHPNEYEHKVVLTFANNSFDVNQYSTRNVVGKVKGNNQESTDNLNFMEERDIFITSQGYMPDKEVLPNKNSIYNKTSDSRDITNVIYDEQIKSKSDSHLLHRHEEESETFLVNPSSFKENELINNDSNADKAVMKYKERKRDKKKNKRDNKKSTCQGLFVTINQDIALKSRIDSLLEQLSNTPEELNYISVEQRFSNFTSGKEQCIVYPQNTAWIYAASLDNFYSFEGWENSQQKHVPGLVVLPSCSKYQNLIANIFHESTKSYFSSVGYAEFLATQPNATKDCSRSVRGEIISLILDARASYAILMPPMPQKVFKFFDKRGKATYFDFSLNRYLTVEECKKRDILGGHLHRVRSSAPKLR